MMEGVGPDVHVVDISGFGGANCSGVVPEMVPGIPDNSIGINRPLCDRPNLLIDLAGTIIHEARHWCTCAGADKYAPPPAEVGRDAEKQCFGSSQ